jgi:hypothetical protein
VCFRIIDGLFFLDVLQQQAEPAQLETDDVGRQENILDF